MSVPDALEAYAADCREAAVGYIERATRFGAADLHIRETAPAARRVRITVRVELEVCSESEDLHGVHQPDPDDLSLADGAAYQQAVAAQARAEVDTHGRAYVVLPIVSPLRVLPPDPRVRPRALPPSTGRDARQNPRDVRGGQ